MPESPNLLPPERARAHERAYTLRLTALGLTLATGLALIASLLLVPTYVLLNKSVREKQAKLAAFQSALSSGDQALLSTRLAALSENVAGLVSLADQPSVSASMRAVLAVIHPGITLSSFLYTPRTGDAPATLSLTGTAETRNALRGYQLALQSAPVATAAAVPVSAYAADANIPFTVVVTLAP